MNIETLITGLAISAGTLTAGITPLLGAISDLADVQKTAQIQVCHAKSAMYDATSRTAVNANCIAKANARIDTEYAPVKGFLTSIQIV